MRNAFAPSWQSFSVLLADVPDGVVRHLDHCLEASGYAVIRTESGDEAVEVACAARPDAVIVGVDASVGTGIDVCRRLRGDPRFPAATPVILVADADAPGLAEAAYRAGAWDVCRAVPDTAVLLLKLQTFVRARLVGERVRAASLIDADTGLYSPAGLAVRAREVDAAARRTGEHVSCIALCFAADEGSRGNDRSEPLTRHAAAECRRLTRGSDVLGRMTEVELALIAPGAGSAGAGALVARIRRHLDDRPGCVLRAVARSAPMAPNTEWSVPTLLADAREALQHATTAAGITAVDALGGGPAAVRAY